jgi:hypothetical protein
MKTLVNLLILSIIVFGCVSCDHLRIGGGCIDRNVYIYIVGDANRTVQISYLEEEKVKNTSNDHSDDGSPAPEYVGGNKNIIITESVTLPFFKDVHYVGGIDSEKDAFLEIISENDSTTKAIIFDDWLLLEDNICGVFFVWETENAVNECAYCKDLPKDSVLTYSKKINYPCYLEFSKGDVRKKVEMRNYWGY